MPSQVGLFGPDDKNTTIWSPGSEQNPDGCANVYSSLFVEGYFYKVCPTGFSSNQLYISFPAGYVSSTVSQEEATQFARELLAARGQEIADAQGVCTLGEFQEVFSTVDATYNWDWVADKGTIFPREIKNVIPDGSSLGTGDDSGIVVEFPIGNSLSWPLMIGFFYSGQTAFLSDTTNQINADDALRFDIQDPYGLIHLDLRSYKFSSQPNLTVFAGKDENSNGAGPNSADNYSFQNTCLYLGKLVADFGSREIYGPAWDPDTEGPSTNSYNPNPNEIPEFSVASLGGFLFRIDTTSRSVINGKIAGVYLVCYKEDIQVYKYDAMTDDYESLYSIPFNPKDTTTYYGCSILTSGSGVKTAEIYIDGQFELSIPDDTLTNIHLPICYERGVYSVDHWVGDIVTGVTYPGTNRLPPPITTRYFEPTDILNPDVTDPTDPLKKILYPFDIVGASTALEANKPMPKLAAGEVGVGFTKDLLDVNDKVTNWFGGAFFGQATNVLMNFDLSVYPELGKVLWGAHALQVGKIEMNRYSSVPGIPSNPYRFLMTAYQIAPIIPKEDIPGIDWPNYDLFQYFVETYNQHPRWSCSWDGIFQPSDIFTEEEAIEENNATEDEELDEEETIAFNSGLYLPAAIQSGDGWLYTTSMINMLPGRVFTNLSTGEFKDIVTKDDLSNHYYFFTEGWYLTQVLTDLFSGIRTVKLMTGVQGKRTSEVLTAPEYDFHYRCPLPPADPDPINVNLECPNKEFRINGIMGPITGGTHYPLTITDWKDCLFGDPYSDVCYPSRKTWFNGFGFVPALQIVFNAGQGIQVQFDPQPNELLFLGSRILEKLHVEFPILKVEVYKEGWPGLLYSGEVFINARDTSNDPPASDLAYSTLQEACYFVPSGAIARYEEQTILDSPMIDLVEVGARYKFVFTLPGI